MNSLKLAIMQPYFMPYIGYWQLINASDKFIPYSNVNFIKKGWINRNRIIRKDGSEYLFTIPLHKQSSNINICEIRIDNRTDWSKKLLFDIFYCYKSATYFDEFFPVLQNILCDSYEKISDLNCRSIQEVCSFLDIKTEIDCDNSRFFEMEEALKNIEENYSAMPELELTRPDKKTSRVLWMCRIENAKTYINPTGGQDLYSKEEFAKYNLNLEFLQTDDITYRQNTKSDNFVPYLSIIDVIMNNGKEETKMLLNKCHTI